MKTVKQVKLFHKTFWVLLGACCLIVGFWYWYQQKYYPSTDDAYVQANIIQIAAQVSGPVAQTFVQEHQHVHQGQLLFTLDPTPFQVAANKAAANLQYIQQQVAGAESMVQAAQALVMQRQAELDTLEKDAKRTFTLVKQGQLPKANADDTHGQLAVAKAALAAANSQLQQAKQQLGKLGVQNAQYQAAQADLKQALLNLSYTQVKAPANGVLNNFNIRSGTMVSAYTPLFNLIEEKQWWVDANFKETQLKRIHPGQKVTIELDIYPNYRYDGIVQSISSGSGAAFSLFPPENATGNWVKVTQRFPVRILITLRDRKHPLRVGASSQVTINTLQR